MPNRRLASQTAWLPVCSATRILAADTAGGEAPPGTVKPIASAAHAMVEAVPITEQVPTLGTNSLLICAISASSISPARNRPHWRRQSVHAPMRVPR